MDENKINRFLIKTARWSGWILGVLMLLYFISGYGITKGIIEPVLAKSLHEIWLPIPTFLCFLFHFFVHFRFRLKTWIKDEVWTDIYIAVLSLVLLIIFFYLYLL